MCTPSADVTICGEPVPAEAGALAAVGGGASCAEGGALAFLLQAASPTKATDATKPMRRRRMFCTRDLSDSAVAENLARIEDTVRIERALHCAHELQFRGRSIPLQLGNLE